MLSRRMVSIIWLELRIAFAALTVENSSRARRKKRLARRRKFEKSTRSGSIASVASTHVPRPSRTN
jgi:hypothetical protein